VFLPLPHSVKCEFEIGPQDAAAVYVEVNGRVEEIKAKEGDRVERGQLIMVLSNPDLELAVLDLQGQRTVNEVRLRSVERERFKDDQSGLQLGQLREMLVTTTQQLEEKQRELLRLRVVAPAAGVVIPAPPKAHQVEEAEGRLPTWSGSPLAPKNLGAAYPESELICRVGDPTDLEALLVVDQADIDLVDAAIVAEAKAQAKPKVKLEVDAFPGRTLHSYVEQVARVELKAMSASLSSQAGGRVETTTDRSGVSRPLSTSYQARVPLDDQGALKGLLCTGMRGRAQIYTQWQSLGARAYRYVSRTFHFEL